MKTPTPATYSQLSKIISGARFPQNTAKVLANLVAVFQQNLNNPYELHKGPRPLRNRFGTDLPKGQRDERMLRNLLIAELYRSWILVFEKEPSINNKGYTATEFVIFAEQIFYLLRIGKIEDHLEEFQSFRVQSLKSLP